MTIYSVASVVRLEKDYTKCKNHVPIFLMETSNFVLINWCQHIKSQILIIIIIKKQESVLQWFGGT